MEGAAVRSYAKAAVLFVAAAVAATIAIGLTWVAGELFGTVARLIVGVAIVGFCLVSVVRDIEKSSPKP